MSNWLSIYFYNRMGQGQQSKPKEDTQIRPTLKYEVDLHLVEVQIIIPSTFSYAIQKLISELEEFANQIEEHRIERYLIHALDQRFTRVSRIDEEAFHAGRDFAPMQPLLDLKWRELDSKQQFLKLINRLKRSYHIEVKMKWEYERQLNCLDKKVTINAETAFESFRKGSLAHVVVQDEMDEGLIMRLILYFYLKMFKLNANVSKHVLKFHTETGRMLCQLIFYQYLGIEQLFEIFYDLVCIDKYGERVLLEKLSEFHRKFNGVCLKHSHSINLNKRRLQTMQTAARMYLDELYLKSLEEAEDPQIKNTDDTLSPIKVFPISRVKDKQRI